MILTGRPEVPKPRRILLLQLRRIGDTLLGTPAIRALAHRFPDAKIDFIAENPAHEVLLGNPHIAKLLIAPKSGEKGWWNFVRELRREKYDWVIDFMSNPRSAQFTFLSGANIRVGLNKFGRRWAYTHKITETESDRDLYAVDLRLEILRKLGVPAAGRGLEIYADQVDISEADRAKNLIAALKPPIAAVVTGSANPAKRYPADLAAQVIHGLLKNNVSVVLTAGPPERKFADDILSHLKAKIPLLDNARVPTLAALFRNCAVSVVPDSGPKHVAVACGTPTVTIFGPGRPNNWNDPQSTMNIVLYPTCELRPDCVESECAVRQDLRKISPQSIVDAAMKLIRQ